MECANADLWMWVIGYDYTTIRNYTQTTHEWPDTRGAECEHLFIIVHIYVIIPKCYLRNLFPHSVPETAIESLHYPAAFFQLFA